MTVITGSAFCHVAWFGNVGLRVGKGKPRHKDVATAQEPRKLLARTRKAPAKARASDSGELRPRERNRGHLTRGRPPPPTASRGLQDGIIIRESNPSRLVSIIAAAQERPQPEPGPSITG